MICVHVKSALLRSFSDRLLHPCYSDIIPDHDTTEDTAQESPLSRHQFNNVFRIEVCEAKSRTDRYISLAVLEACLNLFYNRTLYRRRPLIRQTRPVSEKYDSWNRF